MSPARSGPSGSVLLGLALVAGPGFAQPPGANYDETRVPAYTLPDPLRFLDGRAVRARCDTDPSLGYELTRRLARVVTKRLEATRIRLIVASSPAVAR